MAEITAATVKELRDRTGLPMMDCKKALSKTGGDINAAIEELRKSGQKTMAGRADRETSAGRVAVYASVEDGVGAMVELLCESAPVANHEEFVQFANDLATQLAKGPGAANVDELLKQESPSKKGTTLGEQRDDIMNRMREVLNIPRILRIDGACGGYAHYTGTDGVLLEVKGDNGEVAKDICMHIAALKPSAMTVEDLDGAVVAKEREILTEAAKAEGKPEKIIDKMVEGRMKNFYAESVLTEQPFVKDDKKTVGAAAKEAGLELMRFVHWKLGAS